MSGAAVTTSLNNIEIARHAISPGGDTVLSQLGDYVLLSRATDLARIGRYDEAEYLLNGLRARAELKLAVLDLRARIQSQKRCFSDAYRLWSEVLDEYPENAAARAGLARLDSLMASPHAARDELVLDIRIFNEPGLIVGKKGRDILIQLETYPFIEGGHELTETAQQLLTLLGRRLESLAGRIILEVSGSNGSTSGVASGRSNGDVQLGMERAYAVFQHLVRTTQLQPWMCALRSIAIPVSDGVSNVGPPAIAILIRPS